MSREQIAVITQEVIDALGLDCSPSTPIYLGDYNIEHMKESHPADYNKHERHIEEILNNPEYVGINPTDESIEYVREYKNENAEYVKVAVRVALSGDYYARSLYSLRPARVESFIKKGTLKDLRTKKETR